MNTMRLPLVPEFAGAISVEYVPGNRNTRSPALALAFAVARLAGVADEFALPHAVVPDGETHLSAARTGTAHSIARAIVVEQSRFIFPS